MTGPEEFTAEETAALNAMKEVGTEVEADEQTPSDEPAPAAEPAPEAPAAKEAPKPPEGFVPHGALHAEREERKKAEKEVADLRAEFAALKAQLAPPQPPAAPIEIPDPLLDPAGFAAYHRAQAKAQEDRWAKFEAERAAEAQASARASKASTLEAEFMGKTPDYGDAMTHLMASRQKELTVMGFSPENVAAIIARDANAIFDNAIASGRNPAEVLYESAKLRGYAAKAKVAPAADEEARIAALAEAQDNTASLSTAGGEAQSGGLSYTQLAAMSEEEIRALYGKNGKLPKAVMKALGA